MIYFLGLYIVYSAVILITAAIDLFNNKSLDNKLKINLALTTLLGALLYAIK